MRIPFFHYLPPLPACGTSGARPAVVRGSSKLLHRMSCHHPPGTRSASTSLLPTAQSRTAIIIRTPAICHVRTQVSHPSQLSTSAAAYYPDRCPHHISTPAAGPHECALLLPCLDLAQVYQKRECITLVAVRQWSELCCFHSFQRLPVRLLAA